MIIQHMFHILRCSSPQISIICAKGHIVCRLVERKFTRCFKCYEWRLVHSDGQEDSSPAAKRPSRIIDLPMPPAMDEREDEENESEGASPGADSKGSGPKFRLPK